MAAHSSVPVGEDVWRDFRLLASDGEVGGALEQRHACEVTIVASSSGGQVFSSSRRALKD